MLLKFTALTAVGLAGVCTLMLNSGAGRATANPASDGHHTIGRRITEGALLARNTEGKLTLECPLKHTDVQAEVSGPVARVTVTQDFENTARDKIEAIYVFPLPHNAAVDEMTLTVGNRVITGQIKRRQEAQAIYQAARNAGNVAALLDQERPNIFTQSVANIAPGAKVRVTIRYIEQLTYDAGQYSFSFPMVVGPRYNPSTVTDAERITPPVAPPDQRGGHDISLAVKLDAGLPILHLDSQSHQDRSRAALRLAANSPPERSEQHPEQGLRSALQRGRKTDHGRGPYPQERERRLLRSDPPAAGASQHLRDHSKGNHIRARHFRLDAWISHREGERSDAAGHQQPQRKRHLQSHNLLRRHTHSVPRASFSDTRQPEESE